MAFPNEYRYTREDEWVDIDGNLGTIGITDYAQNALGDIVFVELPKPGDHVTAGQSFGSVESVKAVSDLFCPVSGTVKEVNTELQQSPEKLNQDAHGTWIIKVELSNPDELNGLLSAEDYDAYVKERAEH